MGGCGSLIKRHTPHPCTAERLSRVRRHARRAGKTRLTTLREVLETLNRAMGRTGW